MSAFWKQGLMLAACSAWLVLVVACDSPASTDSEVVAVSLDDDPVQADGDHGHDHADGDHGHDHADVSHADDHEAGDHGHDHDNMTLTSLTTEMEALSTEIQTAFADGTPAEAHDAMHSIAHVIGDLETVANRDKYTDQQTADIMAAAEKLMESFESLDGVLHGGKEIGFEEVEPQVKEAMEALKSIKVE